MTRKDWIDSAVHAAVGLGAGLAGEPLIAVVFFYGWESGQQHAEWIAQLRIDGASPYGGKLSPQPWWHNFAPWKWGHSHQREFYVAVAGAALGLGVNLLLF